MGKIVILQYPDPGYTSCFSYVEFKDSIGTLVVNDQADVYKLDRVTALGCKVIGEIVLDKEGNLVGTPILPKKKQEEPEKVQEAVAPVEVTEVQNGEDTTQPIQGESTVREPKQKRGGRGR